MKFLVADDHQLIREGLRYALKDAFPGLSIVEAGSGEAVIDATTAHPDFDLILLDYYMPETDGDHVVAWLIARLPRIPIVILSAAEDPLLVRRLLECGVAGFVSKTAGQENMISVIRQVLAGEFRARAKGTAATGCGLPDCTDGCASCTAVPGDSATTMLRRLTHRQCQVLMLMTEGKTNKDISRELHISENTIKVHVTAVLKVLGVSNRIQAVLLAQRLGLLSQD